MHRSPNHSRMVAGALAALLVGSLACQDSSSSPTDTQGPSFAGADVFHDSATLLAWLNEPNSGYSVYFGGTADEIATFCATGDFSPATHWKDLAVFLSNGGDHFRDQGRNVPILVYQPLNYDPCSGVAPFASGTVNMVMNEHDAATGTGASTFGFTGSGEVVTPTGVHYRLDVHGQVVYEPTSGVHESGRIALTPLG